MADSYTLLEDQPLVVQVTPPSVRVKGDGVLYSGDDTFTLGDGAISAQYFAGDGSVHVEFVDSDYPGSGHALKFLFAPPTGGSLTRGTTYAPAKQYPAQTVTLAGLDIHRDGQHYNPTAGVVGQFTVLQLVRDGSAVSRFAADFALSTGLSGWVRYHYNPGVLLNDPGGTALTATLARAPHHASAFSFNPDGTFAYTPEANYNGVDSFEYTVTDGIETSPPVTVSLTVQSTYDPPTLAAGPNVTVNEDAGPQAFAGWATVVADSGTQVDDVLVSGNTNPGLFEIQPDVDASGRLTFKTAPNAHGVADLTIVAIAGAGMSEPRTFRITVNNVADAPVAAVDRYDIFAGSTLTAGPSAMPMTFLYLRSDPGDPAGGGRTLLLTPARATFSPGVAASGGVYATVAPHDPPGAAWSLLFGGPGGTPAAVGTYQNASIVPPAAILGAWTSQPSSTAGTFTVLTNQSDSSLRFAADFTQYADGSSAALRGSFRYNVIQGSVLANDTSEGGVPMVAHLVAGATHGSLSFNGDGTFAYTPAAGFAGTDSFTYATTAGGLTSAPTTVTINVMPDLAETVATGLLQYVYPDRDGVPVTAPLAARTVYDDVNNNGVFDAGEPSAVTALDGTYSIPLAGTRTHLLRVAGKAGWTTPAGSADYVTVEVSTQSPGTTPVAAPLQTSMIRPVVIDVVAFQPSGVDASRFAGYFVTANRVFANSDTNVRLNFVGAVPVAYTSTRNFHTDLTRLASTKDRFLADALTARERMNADLGVLFAPNSGEEVGLGYVFNPDRPDADFGFTVVAQTGADEFDGLTLAHEIGHNIGADHDEESGPASAIPYARGYRVTDLSGTVYRDVMAYEPGIQLPFFSSPLIRYAEQPLGRAGVADNARAVREHAYVVASYRGQKFYPNGQPVLPPPTFTPVSVATTKLPVRPGQQVPASAVVRNTSGNVFTGKAVVGFFLSKDKKLDADDTLLRRVTLRPKGLKSGATLSSVVTFKIGAKLKAGTFHVIAVATPTGSVTDERSAKLAVATLKVAAPVKRSAAKPLPRASIFQSSVGISIFG